MNLCLAKKASKVYLLILLQGEPKFNRYAISLFIWFSSRVKSFFRPKEPIVKTIAPRQADINIFTVASGLLYEVSTLQCIGVLDADVVFSDSHL